MMKIPFGAVAPPSPQQRARICEQIARQLVLEFFDRKAAKREVLARLAIGLPPIPRPIHSVRL